MDSHVHKFFVFQTKKEFEPAPPRTVINNSSSGGETYTFAQPQVYVAVDYAFMYCNCGTAKKVKVPLEN